MAKQKNSPKKTVTETEDQETDTQESSEDSDQETDVEDENKRINAIVTNRIKREMKTMQASMAKLIEEQFAKLSPRKSEDEDEDEDTDQDQDPEAVTPSKKQAAQDPKITKQLTRLSKELAEQKARAEKAERERAEQAENARRQEMRNTFQGALTEYGVTDPLLIEAALDRLEKTGQMFRDEDGKVKFKGQDKYGIETTYDPKIGLKTWVQTEGKSYVPAVDAGGSGTGGSRNQNRDSANMSKGQYSKLSEREKASMELERASQGLPPLDA